MRGLNHFIESILLRSVEFKNWCAGKWHGLRELMRGLRFAWVSAASATLGFLLLVYAPQGQDLFLDVRGSLLAGTTYWVLFYFAVLWCWIVPVYVSSRWILTQFSEDVAQSYQVPIPRWVTTTVPLLLVIVCFAVLFLSQLQALANAPYAVESTTRKPKEELFLILSFFFALFLVATVRHNIFVRFNSISDVRAWRWNTFGCIITLLIMSIPVALAVALGSFDALADSMMVKLTEFVIRHKTGLFIGLQIIQIGGLIAPFALVIGYLLTFASNVYFRSIGICVLFLWGMAAIIPLTLMALVLVVIDLRTRLVELTRYELDQPLGLGHLAILPIVTLILGTLAWWYLKKPVSAANHPLITGLLPIARFVDSRARPQLRIAFRATLVASCLILAAQTVIHPIVIADYISRAALVPFVLGILVAPLTFVSYYSFRWHAPIVLAALMFIALVPQDTQDVRTLPQEADRPTLEDAVTQWARANNCELGSTDPASMCPSPIIMAASGGASRSAFLVGTVVGKLLDEPQGMDGVPLRPFNNQLFAISGVSGGALGAVISYAALADSLRAPHADYSRLKPPCAADVSDNDWFARVVEPGSKPSESWRDCLQILLSGDFLSPVITELISNDLLGISPHGDRAIILENAWERRYARLTGRQASSPPSPLETPITSVRASAVSGQNSPWLPMIILGGTSVTSGRRIVTTDIDTLLSERVNNLRSRLFRDAYDTHELISETAPITGTSFSPDGQQFIVWHGKDARARIWHTISGKIVRDFNQVDDDIATSVWLPSGNQILTWSPEGATKLWDPSTGEASELLPSDTIIEEPHISADGNTFLLRPHNEAVLWDRVGRREISRVKLPEKIHASALSPDGKSFVVVIEGNVALLYDAERGSLNWKIEPMPYPSTIRFSPDGQRIIAKFPEGSESSTIIYDAVTGAPILKVAANPRLLAISPDGRLVLHAASNGSITIRDLANRKPQRIPNSASSKSGFAIFSPDGRYALYWVKDRDATLIDIQNKKIVRTLRHQDGDIGGAVFHPGGQLAFTWSESNVGRLWNIETGEELHVIRSSRLAKNCTNCDIRLSTAGTMSARFPIVSPHGNLRSRDRINDRVVDGGYFENYGALTALEVAEHLRNSYGLDPRVILIDNEPHSAGMSCLSHGSQLPRPQAPQAIRFSTIGSPLIAMWATRNARGTHAAVDLCSRIGGGDKFAFVTVAQERRDRTQELSMSWWLSKHVQQALDSQVDRAASQSTLDALSAIESWRRYAPSAPGN